MTVTKERAAFTIDRKVLQTLKELVPEQKRSKFVEVALAQALGRESSDNALKLLNDLPAWPTGGKPAVETLREIRGQWGGRLVVEEKKAR